MKFCRHKWSNWADPVTTYTGHLQQWRYCEHCNKFDFRTLGWHNQTGLSNILQSIVKLRGK